jgi:hypothetical protein
MSEDCHDSKNDMSVLFCCVEGCEHFGKYDVGGRLYCEEHKPCDGCGSTCDVSGCTNTGIILQGRTGNRYCTDHAWESDRPEPATEPVKAEKPPIQPETHIVEPDGIFVSKPEFFAGAHRCEVIVRKDGTITSMVFLEDESPRGVELKAEELVRKHRGG